MKPALILLSSLLLTTVAIAEEVSHETTSAASVQTLLFEPVDAARDRTVPLKFYLPKSDEACPVILFSHGLGGSRNNNPYLGNHWAEHGYVAVFIQHIGSDESVWKDEKPRDRMAALKGATGLQPTLDRFVDIPFVIDQLERWNADEDHPLSGKLDLAHLGMAGHSYGAVTTLAMTDRKFVGDRTLHEKRIDAFLPMSPQPGKAGSPERFFGEVSVPVLCMTGTEDGSPIDPSMAPAERRKVYAAFPPGDKYQLVFEGAEHFAFGEGDGPRTRGRNPKHHPAILEISTKFWDAYLKEDETARRWLQSQAPHQGELLDEKDVWEWK